MAKEHSPPEGEKNFIRRIEKNFEKVCSKVCSENKKKETLNSGFRREIHFPLIRQTEKQSW